MEIEDLSGGAHAVGRVDIATVLDIVVHAPVSLVVGPELLQIVDIATLGIEDVTEETLILHIKGGHLEEVVDAILQHHAVLAGPLGGVDEGPDVVQREGSRHFDSDVLALLHSVLRHLDVGLPIGHNVDQVDIGALDELLPRIVRAVVELCRVATILSEDGVTLLRAILV